MSLLLNILYRLVIPFLPRSKHLLISWLQSPSAVILEPRKKSQPLFPHLFAKMVISSSLAPSPSPKYVKNSALTKHMRMVSSALHSKQSSLPPCISQTSLKKQSTFPFSHYAHESISILFPALIFYRNYSLT